MAKITESNPTKPAAAGGAVPKVDGQQTPGTPPTTAATDITPAPKKSITWWITIMAIIIIVLAAAYAAMNRQSTSSNNTTDNTNEMSTTDDAVTQELQSVSDKSDSTTIKTELQDTNLNDISTEMDDIAAETKGL